MSKPITPDEVVAAKKGFIPDEVFDAFNELIAINFDGVSAFVDQEAAVETILARMASARPGINRTEIFERHWLNVEDIYREAGWLVEYDKPGYNETYPAKFVFRRPKK